jgi:predicted phage terminase large subunit-like protein
VHTDKWLRNQASDDGADIHVMQVGEVPRTKHADRYLDQVRDRLGFPDTVVAVKAMTKKWPKANLKLVEDKANGPAVIQSLRREIPGLVAVVPGGGQVARAQAVSPQVESGNVISHIQRSRPGWRL